jgi:hypothetical protein
MIRNGEEPQRGKKVKDVSMNPFLSGVQNVMQVQWYTPKTSWHMLLFPFLPGSLIREIVVPGFNSVSL